MALRTDPPVAPAPVPHTHPRAHETEAEMLIGDGSSEGDDDGAQIAVEWKTEVSKYGRSPTKGKTGSDSRGVGVQP